MIDRLDLLLLDYDKEREAATTLEQLKRAARNLVERIDQLEDKTQIEHWVRQIFIGLT